MTMPAADRRAALSRLLGGATAGLFTSLLPGALQAQSPRREQNAWAAAQESIQNASRMAERASATLGSLGSQTRSALERLDKLTRSVQELKQSIADLTAKRDRLMEEFRNGKFCSGCNRTRSEILARGEQFPHPGQREVRPTQAQIEAKERELQAPIDRSERQLASQQPDLVKSKADADNGIAQIRVGVLLWRTSVTYWGRAVQRGLHKRREELQQSVTEFQAALDAELRRISRLPPAEQQAAQSDTQMWQRLLDQHQQEIAALQGDSSKAVMRASEQRRAQLDGMLRSLTAAPLDKVFNPANVNDAPIMSGENPLGMGVTYLMGRLVKMGESHQNLSEVTAFVAEYRSFGALHIDAQGAFGTATVAPAAVSAPPPARAGNPLLQALP